MKYLGFEAIGLAKEVQRLLNFDGRVTVTGPLRTEP